MPFPRRSPTHLDLPHDRLARLAIDVEALSEDGAAVPIAALVDLAEDQGKPVSHFLAAMALATDLQPAPSGAPILHVCAGRCQSWGALDVLDAAASHAAAGRATLRVASCLNQCEHAAAVAIETDDGRAVLAATTAASLAAALDDLRGA